MKKEERRKEMAGPDLESLYQMKEDVFKRMREQISELEQIKEKTEDTFESFIRRIRTEIAYKE